MSGTEDSNQRWFGIDYTTDYFGIWITETVLTITETQIWLHVHELEIRIDYRQKKMWVLNNLQLQGVQMESLKT